MSERGMPVLSAERLDRLNTAPIAIDRATLISKHSPMKCAFDPTQISVISFDLDDTLWHTAPVIERAEQVLHDWLAEHHPRLTERFDIAGQVALRKQLAREQPLLAQDMTVLRKAVLRRAALATGCPESLVEPAFELFIDWRNRVTLFDDAEHVLGRLAERYQLVALTNGNADVARIGIDHHFTLALSPSLQRRPKPHADLFEDLCAALEVRPEQVLHVGDNPLTDIGGARGAGMRSAWFNGAGAAWPAGQRRADLEVDSLSALLDRLLRQPT
jgi:putative hydrolase of the HAD superfamily